MAMKTKSIYVCSSCGYETAKWLGKCPECGEWASFEEEVRQTEASKSKASDRFKPKSVTSYQLTQIEHDNELRYKTGMGELD